jgi:hypothetical protein
VLVVARPRGSSALVGWTHTLVRFGTEARVDVVLQAGAKVTGALRDGRGRPLAGLEVSAEWEGTSELGQFEDDIGPFVSDPSALTAADGTFKIAGLLPGEYDLRVKVDGFELARHEVRLAAGEEVAWDPVVDHASSLRVRATSADGTPLARWRVELVNGDSLGSRHRRLVTLDADGRGALHGLPDAERYDLALDALGPDGRYDSLPEALRPGIAATREEVLIQLAADERPTTTVRGRWPVAEVPAGGVRLKLVPEGRGRALDFEVGAEGTFELVGVTPARYRLMTDGRGFPSGETLATFAIAAREVVDLGTLALPRFTRLEVTVVREDGAMVRAPEIELLTSDGRNDVRFRAVGDSFSSSPVRSGSYVLRVACEGAAVMLTPLEVGEAPLQPVRVVCSAGRVVALTVRSEEPSSDPTLVAPSAVSIEVRDAQDRVALRRVFTRPTESLTFTAELRLVPGSYKLRAADESPARRGRATVCLEVADAGAPSIVDIVLRR